LTEIEDVCGKAFAFGDVLHEADQARSPGGESVRALLRGDRAGARVAAPRRERAGEKAGAVTLVHGISNKPPQDALTRQWVEALKAAGGPNLEAFGTSVATVYWADILYAEPELPIAAGTGLEAFLELAPGTIDGGPSLPHPKPREEAEWLASLAMKLGAGTYYIEAGALVLVRPPEETGVEVFPFPAFIEKAFIELFLRDAHHYLCNETVSPRPGETFEVRREIQTRFVETLRRQAEKGGPQIVVSHSLGTVIAYDCLKTVSNCPPVDALITIGSPLGLDEVQTRLPGYSRVCVYAELYRVLEGVYPVRAILYFLNELDLNPDPAGRPLRAVYEVQFTPETVQQALVEFDATAQSIISCRTTNGWPLPSAAPVKETCDICDIRWNCTCPAVSYPVRMPIA
jgi:hypothetical protein